VKAAQKEFKTLLSVEDSVDICKNQLIENGLLIGID
jgi:hypothetical protein